MNNKKQAGFTLVEIAIVLVIIGLLLGGILKGQELINSARVRNLADQSSGIQAAYFGFIDRYRQVPGDWATTGATPAIGQTINTGGNGNGRIDDTLAEAVALWEQLAKSNFLGGGFTPATAVPAIANYPVNAPLNAFNGSLVLTRNDGYSGLNPAIRLNLHMGINVPVTIARELDLKVDDGLPNTGVLRLTNTSSGPGPFDVANFYNPTFATCTTQAGVVVSGNAAGTGTDAAAQTDIFDIFDDAQDCAQVFVY